MKYGVVVCSTAAPGRLDTTVEQGTQSQLRTASPPPQFSIPHQNQTAILAFLLENRVSSWQVAQNLMRVIFVPIRPVGHLNQLERAGGDAEITSCDL